jgi:hypothetical protein
VFVSVSLHETRPSFSMACLRILSFFRNSRALLEVEEEDEEEDDDEEEEEEDEEGGRG